MSLLLVGVLLLGGVEDGVNGVDVVNVSEVGDRGVRVGDVGLAGKAGFSTVFSGEISGKLKKKEIVKDNFSNDVNNLKRVSP